MNYARYAVINARHLPHKVCLIERTPSKNQRRTLTWKQFNDEINRVANYITKELGVKDSDFVMLLQSNCLEWLINYYGIIKTGAVIVPLNYRFDGPDILYAANVCEPKFFMLGSEFVPVVQSVQLYLKTVKKYICIGDSVPNDMTDYKTIAAYKDTQEAIVDVEDQHDLAMMFTSGTTGTPKAVIHTHYSLNNTAISNGMSYFVEKNDNYVFFLPLYHSGTLFLWAPFYATGATGTILREFTEPKWILEAIAQEKGTDILFVVPVAVMILNAIKNGQLKLSDYELSSLKYLEIGGQPVPFEIMKGLVANFPCAVSNIYGITEGGGGGTFNLYSEDALRKPGSIGKPTFGVEGKIVDFDGKDVPPGQVGELIFRTNRMMKEYYKNPEMTADALKNGWLYTGDLLQTDDEGYFYIVDRKKDMISSGGENIFPVEIEAALMQSPKIDDVAYIGYPDDRLVEVVMAIIQVKQGQTMSEEEVLNFCKKVSLAKYKWPRKIIFDTVMRSLTGKLMKPQMRKKFTGRKEAFKLLD